MPNQDDREKAINGLVFLGLSIGEAKTYVALLEHGPSEATPLSKIADVPQPKVYSYLNDLETRHFVDKTVIEGKPNFYEARSYELVLEELENQYEAMKTNAVKALSKINVAKDMEVEKDYVSIVQGSRSVNLRLKEELWSATKNILIFETPYYLDLLEKLKEERPNIEILRPIDMIRTSNSPIMMFFDQMMRSPEFSKIKENQPFIIMTDFVKEKKTCKSFMIVAHPFGNEDPLLIKITHPLIVNFQASMVDMVLNLLMNMKMPNNQFTL